MLPPPQPRPGRHCDFALSTQVVHGPGSLARLPDLLRELGATSAVLVSDAALVQAGHVRRVTDLLRPLPISLHTFTDTCENPTDHDAQQAAPILRPWLTSSEHPVVLALGGGSVIDTAKAATLLAHVGGTMAAHRGWMAATSPTLTLPPILALPTTAGTGSEVQSYALVRDDTTHGKMACGLSALCPRVALLDAQLTLSCPPGPTALAGLDALSHALETSVCTARTDFSLALSQRAFALIHHAFEITLAQPQDLAARQDMLTGSCLAGMAIEQSMLGAAHALANPLSAMFAVPHGRAVGLLLPAVIRCNQEDPAACQSYEALWPGHAPEDLARWVESLLRLTGQPQSLRELGVTEADLPALTAQAMSQWTLRFNPRPLTPEHILQLYKTVLNRG